MVITKYNPKIEVIQECFNPSLLVKRCARLTMFQNECDDTKSTAPQKIVDDGLKYYQDTLSKSLLNLNHTSLFEHISYTFKISQVTRSFLAQLTRHRMGSFTSGSQHYQDYRKYGFSIDAKLLKTYDFRLIINSMLHSYSELIDAGVPKEEARQSLPNGMWVNIIWTVNARSLINFLNLRLCRRNVNEMVIFSNKLHALLRKSYPSLFNHVGPDCYMSHCKQGKMKCKVKQKWK
jgi:thymidylate synthase (FAD)